MGKIVNGFEELIYVISCILLLGTPWIAKIVIKRAVIEANKVK